MSKINRRLLLMGMPFIIGFLILYLLPLLRSVYYSLLSNVFEQRFVGLANYKELLGNSYFRLSVVNTLMLIAVGTPLLVTVSLMLALFVKEFGDRFPLLRFALILPMLLPSTAVTSIFAQLAVSTPRAMLLSIYVWKSAGFIMLIFLAAFSMIPVEIYEAASLDGAGKTCMFFRFTLPMILGSVLFAGVLACSYNLRLFREAHLLFGAYPEPQIYLTQHFMNNQFYKLSYQNLTTASTLFFSILLPFVWVGVGIATKFTEERTA